MEDISLKIEY